MQIENLSVPIYLKKEEFKWPTHKFFYIFASNGLFMCRNHPFYQSCVNVGKCEHPDLVEQEEFLDHSYPKLSQRLMEDIVGFFGAVEEKYHAEAYVLLGYDLVEKAITMLVPEQEVSMASADYKLPNYPNNWILIGDVHSHSTMAAYSSGVDVADEKKRTGLHIVVGKVDKEPPDWHTEIVVDGTRFKLKDPTSIFEGYNKRSPEIPKAWMDKVTRKYWQWSPGEYKAGYYGGYGGSEFSGSDTYPHNRRQTKAEKKAYKKWWDKAFGL